MPAADPGTADTELMLTSVRAHDGYLQESHETSQVGGFADGTSEAMLCKRSPSASR